jgi:hypothetical protein
MITLKKNRKPILPHCKFLCDGKLDKKLDGTVRDFKQKYSTINLNLKI